MHFKLIIAFVEDSKTDDIMEAAREAGATGCTVINNARGEGIKENKTFFGLTLASQRDVILLLVEQHLSRDILEHIGEVGEFDAKPGTGIAVVIDVEDAVGVMHQAEELGDVVEGVDGTLDVLSALKIMKKVEATSLIVRRRDDLDEHGLLLFSDIAKEVIAKDRAPERVNVYEVMAKPVLSVRPDMQIRYCARLFDNFGISHAPVVEDDKIVGIVSYYLLVLHGIMPDLD